MTDRQYPATTAFAADHDPFRYATEVAHQARADAMKHGLDSLVDAVRSTFGRAKA